MFLYSVNRDVWYLGIVDLLQARSISTSYFPCGSHDLDPSIALSCRRCFNGWTGPFCLLHSYQTKSILINIEFLLSLFQIFVCVVHNESLVHLYVGNIPEDGASSSRFSLSLERILFFKPNLTFTDSWLKYANLL